MARFQEQHGQYFLGFSYFANLPATCLWNNSKIWVRNKVIIGRIVRSEHLIISLSPRSKISFCYLYENIYFLIHNLLNLLRVAKKKKKKKKKKNQTKIKFYFWSIRNGALGKNGLIISISK